MGRPRKSTPTDGELKILQAMWQVAPATLRDIRDAIPPAERPSTAALAQAAILMLDKGLIRVVDPRRPQKFAPVASRDRTYSAMVKDLQKRVFGGSLRALVLHALGGPKASSKDIEEVRSILEQLGSDDRKADAKG